MSDYEVYDLSGGWYELLKKNFAVNNDAHSKIAENTASEEVRNTQLGIINENEKVLNAINKYMRFNMTVKVFSNQALRLFWVLIENNLFFKNELDKAKKQSAARKTALQKIKEAAAANDFEEVRRIIEGCESRSNKKDAPTEADAPKDD